VVLKERMEPDEPDDLTLAAEATRGDERAFTQLFHRYHSMIHALAYRLTLDASLAEDVAHETFLKAARGLGSFQARNSFKGWLYHIGLNSTRDALRRRQREGALSSAMAQDAAVAREVRRPDFSHLAGALAALAEDLREAVALVYYDDLSHAEAAAILGCAETTVSWRIFRAKRQLRKLLQP
jgi:RNA polymerase sigma-70 factor (ECF subfamily)